jgi:hypothetical protein
MGHPLMAIIWQPEEVWDELKALGLDYDGLVDCVRYAEQEWSFVNSNDPVGFHSLMVYGKAGRALREKYVGPNWLKDNSDNQCAIVNLSKKVRVMPCNFDKCAGDRLRNPTNRAPKGEASRQSSMCNRTLTIPGLLKEDDAAAGGSQYQNWLLGIYIDGENATKAELSLAIDFDGQYYTEFARRIILLSGNEDDGLRRRRDNEDPTEEAEIVIRRK